MHDEEWDLLFLIAVLFAIVIATASLVAYNMKPDRTQVHTLISQDFIK